MGIAHQFAVRRQKALVAIGQLPACVTLIEIRRTEAGQLGIHEQIRIVAGRAKQRIAMTHPRLWRALSREPGSHRATPIRHSRCSVTDSHDCSLQLSMAAMSNFSSKWVFKS